MNKLEYDIWLSSIKGIGPATFDYLIKHFHCSKNIWNSTEKDFINLKINNEITNRILDINYKKKVLSDINLLYEKNIEIISIDEPSYSNELRLIKNPPKILYLLGNKKVLNDFSLSIVGSRTHSLYGASISQKFSFELAKCGVTIVSGLANGIDSYSHKGTLLAKGKTIAILAGGFKNIYPKNNITLFNQIIENGGATLTEYLPSVPAIRGNFLARNRIISGISKGTLVIEANKKSGALVTANFAIKQNKKIFCIPSNIDTTLNQGGHDLIKKGAKIVTNINDILNAYSNFNINKFNSDIFSANTSNINDIQKRILQFLSNKPTNLELISKNLNINISMLNSSLTTLELQGNVKRLPGNNFILKG